MIELHAWRTGPAVTGFAVAGLALVPYLTVALPFETALRAQAAGILAILLVVAVAQRAARGSRDTVMSRGVAVGIGIYAAAAFYGCALGIASGNPVRYIASQTLAMLLLPLSVLAFRFGSPSAAPALVKGLSVASLIALGVHLAWPGLGPSHGAISFRLGLARGGSFVEPALMTLLLALAYLRGHRSWTVGAGAVASTILIIGGMSRAEWMAALVGLALLAHFWGRTWSRAVAGALLVCVGVIAGVVAAWLWAGTRTAHLASWDFETATPRPHGTIMVDASRAPSGDAFLLLQPRTDGPGVGEKLARRLPLPDRRVEVSGWISGPQTGWTTVWLRARDQSGTTLATLRTILRGTGTWRRFDVVATLPRASRHLALEIGAPSGTWLVDDVALVSLTSPLAARIRSLTSDRVQADRWLPPGAAGWGEALAQRLVSGVAAVLRPATDPSLQYRLREAQAVGEAWSDASWPRRLAGRGLGATFAFENAAFGPDGRPILQESASYIHNFYLFLSFKLGLVGLAVVVGLALIVRHSYACARAPARGWDTRWVCAASAAAWSSYLVWSVTSPEIYDFRMAPLWGALVAAVALTSQPSSHHSDVATPSTRSPSSG